MTDRTEGQGWRAGWLGLALLSLLSLMGCENKPPCEPNMVYGPKPCVSDQECIDAQGAGWYCDKNHVFDDGCGGKSNWPLCKQKQ